MTKLHHFAVRLHDAMIKKESVVCVGLDPHYKQIPDFLKENLFRPFRSTKKGGLGIGLLMCKTLIESHGGNILIESKPREGSTVTVRLPASAHEEV